MTTGSLSDLKRAIDIKLEVQTSVRLIPEIVGQTTRACDGNTIAGQAW